nr:DNA primase [Clostridia bacterium]
MKIPEQIVEEIKYRNPIEDVISSYVTLKRAGSNMSGLCPFHSEKSPSFTVFTSGDPHFYCFGCGAGGDVITFIMRVENLDYGEALRFLAKRAGITLPENGEDTGGIKRQRIVDMNRDAARFFHTQLYKNPQALQYLYERSIPNPLIKHFGIGFAPDGFGALTSHMLSLGYTKEELSAGFLCGISKKNGQPYDYFRRRVIFPIINTSGDVIAFGGRVINKDDSPKYLNSSDTPAFNKRRSLFALNFAKNKCAEQLILCEGYMDVVTLHGAGFENAVATLGTAMTPEHAGIIRKYTKKVIISYDSDEAGQNAADKAFRLLGEVGVDTRILKMEGAKDPDEYIKKFGPDKFRMLLDGSRSQFEFKLDGIL